MEDVIRLEDELIVETTTELLRKEGVQESGFQQRRLAGCIWPVLQRSFQFECVAYCLATDVMRILQVLSFPLLSA